VRNGWNFWLQWVLAYTLAATVGRAVGGAVAGSLGGILGTAVAAFIMGILVGAAQGVILLPVLGGIQRWVIATVIGSVVGSTLGSAVDLWFKVNLEWTDLQGSVVGLGIAGAVVGAAQAWVLKDKIREPWGWIPTYATALALQPFVNLAAVLTLNFIGPSVATFLKPLITGAITGGILVWLRQQSKE
jgi:hypothetical protein